MGRHRKRLHYEPPAPRALARVARRGAALSGLTLVLVQAISLGSTLALARLLTPEEVGLYAAGTVLAGFIIVFTEGGLRNALVQRERDVEDAADTVFYATFATGVLLSLLALASAPLVGLLFGNPAAAQIAAVTSGMFLMHALTNVPDALMMRRFNFKRRLIIDPAKAVVYGAVTIAFAAMGYGVWALVIGNYASLATWLIGTWALAHWRPGLGYPSVRVWREMARFAYPLVGWSLSALTRSAVQTALIGRVLGEAALGQYRYGRRLGELPGQAVVQVGSFVIFPAFSRMAGEPERFRRGFFRALRWIWFGTVPLAGLLLTLGQPAVVVLLGERWREAGLLLVAMAGVGACTALQEVAGEAMKGAGQSQRLNYLAVIELVVGVGLLVALLPLGLLGVGLAVFGMELVIAVVALVLARSVVGFPGRALIGSLLPAFAATVMAAAVVGPLEHLLVHSDRHGAAVGFVLLLGQTILFGLVYLLALRILDPTIITELIRGARRLLARRRSAGDSDGAEDTADGEADDGADADGADAQVEGDQPERGAVPDPEANAATSPLPARPRGVAPEPGAVEATTPLTARPRRPGDRA